MKEEMKHCCHDKKWMNLPVVVITLGGDEVCPGCVFEEGLLQERMPGRSDPSQKLPNFVVTKVAMGTLLTFEDGFDPTVPGPMLGGALKRYRSVDGNEVSMGLYNLISIYLEILIDEGMLRRAEDGVWECVEDGVVTSRGKLLFDD